MKRFVKAVFILTAMVSVFAGCAKEKSDNTFVLGLDTSFPPMGFIDENNEIAGFDIDVAKEVCSRLNLELVCQPISWDAKEQELATGNIDCIWNGFTMTPERLEAMTFSEPYLENAQVVVVLADSPYQTLADFAGKTCGVQEGSSAQEAIRNTPDFADSLSQVVPYKENLTALMDLEVGGVDAVAMDFIVANYMIKTSGKNFRILDEHLSPEEYGIGFKKGKNWKQNLNCYYSFFYPVSAVTLIQKTKALFREKSYPQHAAPPRGSCPRRGRPRLRTLPDSRCSADCSAA